MEPKNRLLIVIAVTVLIVGAMFTSFGRSLFVLNTPSVVLPNTSGSNSEGPSSSGAQQPSHEYQKVEITPETVQNVIATLNRKDSYYRELTVETYWDSGASSSAISIQVWVEGGWSHSRQVLPSGAIRHDLVGESTTYYWYEGSTQYRSVPSDQHSSDLAQRLPTYETVIELESDRITAASYMQKGELPCIYVELAAQAPDTIERYWVSIDSGLLVGAEIEENDQLTYRMTAYAPISPCPTDASFLLPDETAPPN